MYCAIDMSTEIFIVLLSVDLVAHLRVRMRRKFAVVACFAPRLVVVAAALVRALYLYQVTPHENPEYDLWKATICTQIHVCASICTACIPYMVPFFKSLQGNIWRSYSTRSWSAARRRSVHLSGQSPNRLRKREANIRFESPKLLNSVIREPERVSIVSPRIPSPSPISPFLPPPIATLRVPTPTPRASECREARAVSVSGTVYDSESDEVFDMVSLQTAMCFAPSPIEPPAQARLSNAAIADVEAFEYLALLASPDPSNSSSCYSSCASSPTRATSNPRFSLFPQETQRYTPLHSMPERKLSSSTRQARVPHLVSDDGATRLQARQTLPNPAILHDFDDSAHPARSASSRSHPKFSTTPRLHASPPTTVPSEWV